MEVMDFYIRRKVAKNVFLVCVDGLISLLFLKPGKERLTLVEDRLHIQDGHQVPVQGAQVHVGAWQGVQEVRETALLWNIHVALSKTFSCVHVLHVVKEVLWSGGAVGVAVEAEATVCALLPGVIGPTVEEGVRSAAGHTALVHGCRVDGCGHRGHVL